MRNNLVCDSVPDFAYFRDVAKPCNLNEIVRWHHRLYAAWLVFTGQAVAVRWYSYADSLERNGHIAQQPHAVHSVHCQGPTSA